jgi:hypothetical protein
MTVRTPEFDRLASAGLRFLPAHRFVHEPFPS